MKEEIIPNKISVVAIDIDGWQATGETFKRAVIINLTQEQVEKIKTGLKGMTVSDVFFIDETQN